MTSEQAQALLRGQLSRRGRVSHVVLLVATLSIGLAVGSVWLTEPLLPVRTHLAFLAVVIIAFGWTGHAAWVLTHKAVMLVPHQVQAARLAVICTLLFAGVCVAAWMWAGANAAGLATASALLMAGVAGLNLRRASVRYTALTLRRAELLAASSRRDS